MDWLTFGAVAAVVVLAGAARLWLVRRARRRSRARTQAGYRTWLQRTSTTTAVVSGTVGGAVLGLAEHLARMPLLLPMWATVLVFAFAGIVGTLLLRRRGHRFDALAVQGRAEPPTSSRAEAERRIQNNH